MSELSREQVVNILDCRMSGGEFYKEQLMDHDAALRAKVEAMTQENQILLKQRRVNCQALIEMVGDDDGPTDIEEAIERTGKRITAQQEEIARLRNILTHVETDAHELARDESCSSSERRAWHAMEIIASGKEKEMT